jgi:hypothetical protein
MLSAPSPDVGFPPQPRKADGTCAARRASVSTSTEEPLDVTQGKFFTFRIDKVESSAYPQAVTKERRPRMIRIASKMRMLREQFHLKTSQDATCLQKPRIAKSDGSLSLLMILMTKTSKLSSYPYNMENSIRLSYFAKLRRQIPHWNMLFLVLG